jgi:hypothetical protein
LKKNLNFPRPSSFKNFEATKQKDTPEKMLSVVHNKYNENIPAKMFIVLNLYQWIKIKTQIVLPEKK